MIGALLGDIVGSVFERSPIKTTQFDFFSPTSRYTDESVLTIAIAHAINTAQAYQFNIRRFAKDNADVPGGFGSNFKFWLYTGGDEPYNSLGVGPAARVSPIGWAFDSLTQTLVEAEKSALATHSHPEAIKAAKAVAHAIYLGRTGLPITQLKQTLFDAYGYDLNETLDEMRPKVEFDSSAPVVILQAFASVFDANTTEDAIRNAISLGGDADTTASIAGAVAEAFFGVPDSLKKETLKRLPETFLNVMAIFREQQQNLRAS